MNTFESEERHLCDDVALSVLMCPRVVRVCFACSDTRLAIQQAVNLSYTALC